MEIRTYTSVSLNEFIHSPGFEKLAILPISRHRAVSQIHNPRTGESDILLAVQYNEADIIGYLGVLPDYLYQGSGYIKMGWLSCFWVDEAWRTKPVAAGLFLTIIEAWNYRILITNFIPSLEVLYRKTGFFGPVIIKWGVRAFMRSNLAEILPPRSGFFTNYIPILRMLDAGINLIGNLRFLFFREYYLGNLNLQTVGSMDEAMTDFVEVHQRRNFNKRGKTELEWILNYPWILEKPGPDSESKKYYFSSVSWRFRYELIKAEAGNGKMAAVVLLCIRNNSLTVPYVFADDSFLNKIARMIVNIMVKNNLSMVTVFNDELAAYIRQIKWPFLLIRKIKKPYLISKQIEMGDMLNFQDGDGDCVFY